MLKVTQPGDISGHGEGLQFKCQYRFAAPDLCPCSSVLTCIAFLASDAGSNQPSTSSGDRQEDQHVPYSPFNIAYYQVSFLAGPASPYLTAQTYFDVDTTTVLRRVGLSMIPRGGFAVDVCEGSIDLYGKLALSPRSRLPDRQARSGP